MGAEEQAKAQAKAQLELEDAGMGTSDLSASCLADIAAGLSSEPEPEPVKADTASDTSEWVQEWDTMLDELQEMGFEDVNTNREIIAEHNGNLKDAVKELVNRERKSRA